MELEIEEVGGADARWFWNGERFCDGVRIDIDCFFARENFLHRRIIDLCGDFQSFEWLLLSVDDGDRAVVVGILNVQKFQGFLGAEISARWPQMIVVEMPDQARPRVV